MTDAGLAIVNGRYADGVPYAVPLIRAIASR
jgi:hypothetical protein